MATATSSRLVLAAALSGALLVAGCGGSTRPAGQSQFAWLHPSAAPRGWPVGRLPSGTAALAYPSGWRSIRTDPGSFSAALLGPHGRIRGYLNATPKNGPETLANWSRFRVAHNADEGDRQVVRESSASGLRFRSGPGSCVVDRYATVITRYREIACIVRGAHATTVVVAAAQPADWARLAPQLRRAVASFSVA
jgi:hypothetical protein